MTGAKMNANDVMNDMRRRGVKISYSTLMRGAQIGIFPFMHIIKDTGRRQTMIMRTEYEQWANEKIGGYVV